MKIALLLAGTIGFWGCATVTVTPLKNTDFEQYRIPNRIAVAGSVADAQTRAKAVELSKGFAAAGFTTVTPEYVDGMLSVYGFNLKDLVNAGNFMALRDITRLEGIVLVREFYGTEIHFIDVATGKEIASGCWRTAAVTVVNEVLDQVKKKTTSPRVCPVKIE